MTSDSGLCCVIKYGDQMRAWADVGFSTAENNWKYIFYTNRAYIALEGVMQCLQ